MPDERAFDEIFIAHRKRLFNFAYRITGDEGTAEDVTQETFLRAFRSFDSFRGESGVSTWLHAIARNLCVEQLRKKKRSSFRDLESLLRTAASEDSGLYSDLERRSCVEQVKEGCLLGLLRCLPYGQRIAFILNVLYDLPAAETGEVLGKTPNAVRILVHRAKTALKVFLCEHCSLYDPANACRCENLVAFSLKRGWIRKPRTGEGGALPASAIEAELRAFRDETALYRSLREREPSEKLVERISTRLEGNKSKIFMKN